jgi:diguanylate cyclase (GGDEF)-like protein
MNARHRFIAAIAALCIAHEVRALDPDRALTQARLSVWTSESGLPQNTITALAQTRDGYLWMGTEEGLARFDGIRFRIFDRQSAPALHTAFISSLFESADGTLWIGTYGGGLARMRNGRIEPFQPGLLGADRIREMVAMPGGALFVATAGGGLLRIDRDRVTRFTAADGLPNDRIWAIEDDGQGGLWVATHGGGLARWRDGRVTETLTKADGLPNDIVRAVHRDADGTLWIGTDGGGLAVWRDGTVTRIITTRDRLPDDFVRTLLRDRSGTLWIGTDSGLGRWNGTRVEAIGVEAGLPMPMVRSLLEDREGNLWVGTTGGLVRLRDTRAVALTRKEGLSTDFMRAVLEDRTGRIWAGTEGGGLCEIGSEGVRCLTRTDGLPHDTVYALAESADGSLWVGTDGGGVVRLREGVFSERLNTRAGLPNDRIRSLVETRDGTLWVSASAGVARVRGGVVHTIRQFDHQQVRPLLALDSGEILVGTDGAGVWSVSADGSTVTQIASTAAGLGSDRIFALTMDSAGGGVWVGTSGGGLSRLDLASRSVRTLARRNGLHDDVVFQVVDTGNDLFLTSNRGVYRIDRARVIAAMRGEHADLRGTVYGATDGLPTAECVGASPAVTRARDGRLWVSTTRGLAVLDPQSRLRNDVAPPVHIEEALLDGIPAPPGALRVPPDTQRLELHYTAVGLRAPELMQFRYRLDGYDRDWVDAGTARVAMYTRLPPGDYTFRVRAANEDGVQSAGDAHLTVRVEPRWFETWWSRLLGVMLLAGIGWAALRLRTAALRAKKNEELARAYEHVHRIAAELEDTNRQLADANQRLSALSYLDGLTGVANRRRFDEALAEACRVSERNGTELSLAIIDLDHFKGLNDTHGHQEGDEALRKVASLLAARAASRGGLVARFGGEEFAWLMPGVGLEAATEEAERFRIELHETAGPRVTASAGVSSAKGPRSLDPGALVAAADSALYKAKSLGRNRVESTALP